MISNAAAPHQHRNRREDSRYARIAVIGAGMAGATAARALADQGHHVVIFDKGRDAGGRMATRRSRTGPPGQTFDHGAQYFTARDPDFRRQTADWISAGICAPWRATVGKWTAQGIQPAGDAERFVGRPGMSAIARHLISDLDIHTGLPVTSIVKQADGWTVHTGDGQERPDGISGFDAVIVAVPADQAVSLLVRSAALASAAKAAELVPCWTVMATLPDARLPDLEGRPVEALMIEPTDCLAWIADNSSKPDRGVVADGRKNLVLQASAAWSARHLEDDPSDVQSALLSAAGPILGLPQQTIKDPPFATAHRWRYAKVTTPVGQDCLFDAALGLGACGDWCIGPRVEAAYVSGRAMAERLGTWLGTPNAV